MAERKKGFSPEETDAKYKNLIAGGQISDLQFYQMCLDIIRLRGKKNSTTIPLGIGIPPREGSVNIENEEPDTVYLEVSEKVWRGTERWGIKRINNGQIQYSFDSDIIVSLLARGAFCYAASAGWQYPGEEDETIEPSFLFNMAKTIWEGHLNSPK